MEFTLDTAAIRKRFEQAIIGIRQDGTMAVLIPTYDKRSIDLVTGAAYYDMPLSDVIFPTLIRPGDRVEVSDGDGNEIAVYRGFTGGTLFPFSAIACDSDDPDGDTYRYIRPLPAAETEAEVEPETTLLDEIRSAINRNSAENDSDTPDFILARFLTECLNAWNKTVAEREKWYNRSCGGSKSITDNFHPNQPLSRLTAAEQELAAIRAEMEQVQR